MRNIQLIRTILFFSCLTACFISSDQIEAVEKTKKSKEGESVTATSLQWIADHQLADGSWSFDHTIGPGDHRTSPHPGAMKNAKIAATSIALLPFFAAGETHLKGVHKDVIQSGLEFLITNQKETEFGGSYQVPGETMYSHGIASIVLCEAYGVSGDMKLLKPAQAAIDFIVYAQDPGGGGWRYIPRMGGDTSVSGWQITALASAKLVGLDVPKETMDKAMLFLDSTSADEGAYYGYTAPSRTPTNTSIGLLSRMEIGWDKKAPLKKGIEYVSEQGPSLEKANMYHNYFAAQALFAFSSTNKEEGEKHWNEWESKMREFLIAEQSTEGASKGSWFLEHGYASGGGRLYDTALAATILQIKDQRLSVWQNTEEATDVAE